MIKFKYLITFILVLLVCQYTFAEKRKKPLPLEELTNPSSPNYVPYPYPKTEKEIIADLKQAIKKIYLPREGRHRILLGELPTSHKILPNLLEEQPVYKIGRIIKVKNLLSGNAFEYCWQITILSEDDSTAAIVILEANGLWSGTSSNFLEDKPVYLKKDADILYELSGVLGRDVREKDIKHMQAIVLLPHIGSVFDPGYEIKLKKGDVYYYSYRGNGFFKIKKEIPWKKNKKGYRPSSLKLVPYPGIFSLDQINDKVTVYEKIKKKK